MVCALLLGLPVMASADLARDVVVWWPNADERAIDLLRQIETNVLIVPLESVRSVKFTEACSRAGIKAAGALGPADGRGLAEAIRAAKSLGLSGLAIEQPVDAVSVRQTASANPDLLILVYLKAGQLDWDVAPAHAVFREGLWPGIHPVEVDSAGASEKPWVDANAYLYTYLKGMYPNRAAVVSYRPDKDAGVPPERSVPYASLELAIAEARSAGGNLILAVPDLYREGLLKGDARALASWKRLGHTLTLLRDRQGVFAGRTASRIAIVGHDWEQAYELLNMSYRNNLFPLVIPERDVPVLTGMGLKVVAAAGVSPSAAGRAHLTGFARSGGTLVAAPAEADGPRWWQGAFPAKPAGEKEQQAFILGKGRVIVHVDPVLDPAEFALDLVDTLGKVRDLRVWNAPAVLGMVHRAENGRGLLTLLNYGGTHRDIILVRVAGVYQKAVIHRPGAAPASLVVKRRGNLSEMTLEILEGVALIELE